MTWYPGAVGTWWLSGTPGYEVSVERTHLGWTVRIESRQGDSYGYDLVTLALNHQRFTLEDAMARADAIVRSLPAITDAPVVHPRIWPSHPAVIRAGEQKVVIPGAPVRCEHHHAWRLEAGDGDACQCGRLTFGFARAAAKRSA